MDWQSDRSTGIRNSDVLNTRTSSISEHKTERVVLSLDQTRRIGDCLDSGEGTFKVEVAPSPAAVCQWTQPGEHNVVVCCGGNSVSAILLSVEISAMIEDEFGGREGLLRAITGNLSTWIICVQSNGGCSAVVVAGQVLYSRGVEIGPI